MAARGVPQKNHVNPSEIRWALAPRLGSDRPAFDMCRRWYEIVTAVAAGEKHMRAQAGLQVKLKGAAQIRIANIGRDDPRARLEKGNPAGAGGEVIPQKRSQPHQVSHVGAILFASEQLRPKLPVPPVPVRLGDHVAKHIPQIHSGQHQIMRDIPAQHGAPPSGAHLDGGPPSPLAEPIADLAFPDVGFGGSPGGIQPRRRWGGVARHFVF